MAEAACECRERGVLRCPVHSKNHTLAEDFDYRLSRLSVKGELKPCPCGRTPQMLYIEWRYPPPHPAALCYGSCCENWIVYFRFDSNTKVGGLAVEAWNNAPRTQLQDPKEALNFTSSRHIWINHIGDLALDAIHKIAAAHVRMTETTCTLPDFAKCVHDCITGTLAALSEFKSKTEEIDRIRRAAATPLPTLDAMARATHQPRAAVTIDDDEIDPPTPGLVLPEEAAARIADLRVRE